ncbi:hypothetical protein [Pseudomonas simiae]|uniref:hypothetical protein n=1 Tax=Pseudomonas simiae TaxID=321846 RepID=UPI003D6C3C4F
MSDYSDLKAIAEACQQHQPLRFMRSHGALYIRNDNGIVFDVHQNRSFPEFMAQNKDYADLVLAANPETILALIAENERLNTECKQLILLECHGGNAQAAVNLLAERDQLKAENEALRKYGEEFAVLAERRREEVEALRKERDARHPFKPSNEPAIGYSDGCMVCGQWGGHFGLPCPKTRATADAAMGNGEQS